MREGQPQGKGSRRFAPVSPLPNERQFLFLGTRVPGIELRIIEYTMKSLILAQDER